MTLYEFNRLPYERQLVVVFDANNFLATRWEGENAISLYHLLGQRGGFFVELYYDTLVNKITRVRAFVGSTPLGEYAASIQLPELGI